MVDADTIYDRQREPDGRRRRRSHKESDSHGHSHGHSHERSSSEGSRRYKPSRRPGDPKDRPNRSNLLMALGLTVLMVGYGLFLLRSMWRPAPRNPHAKAAPAGTVPAEPLSQEAVDAEQEAKDIEASIRLWNQTAFAIDESERLIKDGVFNKAEQSLLRALKQTPDVSNLHLALTKLYIEQGRHGEAKEHLIYVLDRKPDDGAARLMLAMIHSNQGHNRAALSLAQWILKTDPYSVDAHRIAGKVYLNTGRVALAIPHLRRVVTLEGNDVLAENTLAVAYCRTQQYDRAVDILKQLLVRDKDNSVTFYNLAMCYAYQVKPQDTVEILTRSVQGFGASFVETWIQSADFDAVRDHPLFVDFIESQGFAESEANTDG